MQTELKVHLNDRIVVNMDGTPTLGDLVKVKPEHFTIEVREGVWIHVPYSNVFTATETRHVRSVDTPNGPVQVRLVVDLITR